MNKIIQILVILSGFWGLTASADSENLCVKQLSLKIVTMDDLVSLDNTLETPFMSVIEASYIEPAYWMLFHKNLINKVTKNLRENSDYVSNLPPEYIGIILQVFYRYQELASASGYGGKAVLTALTDPEILTLAVLEYNENKSVQSAKQALRRMREIKPAVILRFERTLRHMVTFLQASGDFEASYRLIDIISLRTPR